MPGPILVAVGASRGGVLRGDEGPEEGRLHARITALWGHTEYHLQLLWNVAPAGTAGRIRVETWWMLLALGVGEILSSGFLMHVGAERPFCSQRPSREMIIDPQGSDLLDSGKKPFPDLLNLQQLPSFLPESLLSLHCLLIHPDPTQTALPPWSISDASWAWGWSILYAHRSLVCHGDGGTVAQRMGSILKELCTQNIYKDQSVWILDHSVVHSLNIYYWTLSRFQAQCSGLRIQSGALLTWSWPTHDYRGRQGNKHWSFSH